MSAQECERWADRVVVIDRFVAGAPVALVFEKLRITAESIARAVRVLLGALTAEPGARWSRSGGPQPLSWRR